MKARQIDLIREDCERVLPFVTSLGALKNSSLLLTGGTGFLGSWLLELINALNETQDFNIHCRVICRNPQKFRAQRPHLANKSWVELIEKDVRGFFEIPSETQWVIHAAASSDSRVHYSDPLSVIDTIVHGTSHVLAESSRLNNLKGLLHLSSALVYGSQPLDLPTIDENQFGPLNCGTPRAAYPEAKRQSESLCHAYRSQYRIPVVTARPFAFIGPYQDLDQPYARGGSSMEQATCLLNPLV
jgi:dTDP-glucose 4,6-dehydratase